ncbi:hypothetical protein V1525DRAFT_195975 [Lipomyces kononenkoae]|uniref:Uncharacterized protein n=1 Tax=Lipomyces kononenkoae TaxID=34357 RepID=A0ACC3SYM1_LIPKO
MEARMLSASSSASEQQRGKVTSTSSDLAASERKESPMSIPITSSQSTSLRRQSLRSSHFQLDSSAQTSSLPPSSSPTSSALSGRATSISNAAPSSTAASGNISHRSLSLSLNTTKPLRCTSLHQSMVPPSSEAAVAMSSPQSRRNSMASIRVGTGFEASTPMSMGQVGYRNSSPATLQQREGSSSLSALGLVSSAGSTPRGSRGMRTSSSEDEDDDDLEDMVADTDVARNFDDSDRIGPSFATDRALFRHRATSSRNGSSDSSSISSPNTPTMFPPSSSLSLSNPIVTAAGSSNMSTTSYFPGLLSTDEDMPSPEQAPETRHNSMSSRLRESLTFSSTSSGAPTAVPAPIPTSPIEEMPRRAVVFSRLGGGSLKPQTRSFMRITRELADEVAPGDAEIKHEAEITNSFRDDFSLSNTTHDYDDDDTDFASLGRRTDGRPKEFDSSKYEDSYAGNLTRDAEFPSDNTMTSPISSGKLLESPPFRRRKRAASSASLGYWSDRRGDDEDDMNDTDDSRREDNGIGILSAGASPVTGAVYMPAMKRPSDGWESPLSTSPVGSTDRKLKRRGTMDERFEPYSIKRRAVSPGMVTAASPTIGSPGTFAAGKRSVKQMQDTYDRIQKMSLN